MCGQGAAAFRDRRRSCVSSSEWAGASGTELAVAAFCGALGEQPDCEIHLVMTDGARRTLGYECDVTAEEIGSLAAYSWNIDDSRRADIEADRSEPREWVVVPCSYEGRCRESSTDTPTIFWSGRPTCASRKSAGS